MRIMKISLLAFLMIACQKNHAPVINQLTADPMMTYPLCNVTLSVDAADVDDNITHYLWSTDKGTLSSLYLPTVVLTTSHDTGEVHVTVIVSDDHDLADTGQVTVYVDPDWVIEENDMPMNIRDQQWTYSQVTVNGAPVNTEVESLAVTVNIDHAYPPDLEIWLFSPDSTQLQLWNGTFPGGIQEIKTGVFAGDRVNGTWTLGIYDNKLLDEGILNKWTLNILWEF